MILLMLEKVHRLVGHLDLVRMWNRLQKVYPTTVQLLQIVTMTKTTVNIMIIENVDQLEDRNDSIWLEDMMLTMVVQEVPTHMVTPMEIHTHMIAGAYDPGVLECL